MGRSIVVVEDDLTFRRLIVRNLEARGHTVRQAGTAAEASGAVLGQPSDLLLLDINLPDGSGWDVLRDLRLHGVELPTIVMSALHIAPSVLAEFQPMACLLKPFALEALLDLVQREHGSVVGITGDAPPRLPV